MAFIDTVPSPIAKENYVISEFIRFFDFDSRDYQMYLVSRDAPTPDEKEIIDEVPFMQGKYDFSQVLGERVFQNRELTYEFHIFHEDYEERKWLEREIKQKVMLHKVGVLDDSHDWYYHWVGKCQQVTVEDDEAYQKLVVKLVFDCYPFLISDHEFGYDEWDIVYFPTEVFQFNHYEVAGKLMISFINNGQAGISPTIEVSKPMILTVGQIRYVLPVGKHHLDNLFLPIGKTDILVEGTGEITITAYKEVMG